jgi:hypothetical protein
MPSAPLEIILLLLLGKLPQHLGGGKEVMPPYPLLLHLCCCRGSLKSSQQRLCVLSLSAGDLAGDIAAPLETVRVLLTHLVGSLDTIVRAALGVP